MTSPGKGRPEPASGTPTSGGRRRAGRHTILDVAALAGVSPATVSRVLGGTYPVAAATRERVQGAIRTLDYVANGHARALHGTGTRVVSMLMEHISGPSFTLVAAGMEQEAARHDRLCMICTTQGDRDRESAVMGMLREQGAEAVILVGEAVDDESYQHRMAEYSRSLAAVGARLVLIGRPAVRGDISAISVGYDNEAAAFDAVTHLLDAGHRRILFLGGRPGRNTSEARRAGYVRALRSADVEVDPRLQTDGVFTRESGYEGTRGVLARRVPFTGVFASSDLAASGAYEALREAGLDIPADVSVIGFDDLQVALDLHPQLTTVHVPFEELGRTAVRLIVGTGADEPVVTTLDTRLVRRGSVGPPGPSPQG